jgi:hypothetical protein
VNRSPVMRRRREARIKGIGEWRVAGAAGKETATVEDEAEMRGRRQTGWSEQAHSVEGREARVRLRIRRRRQCESEPRSTTADGLRQQGEGEGDDDDGDGGGCSDDQRRATMERAKALRCRGRLRLQRSRARMGRRWTAVCGSRREMSPGVRDSGWLSGSRSVRAAPATGGVWGGEGEGEGEGERNGRNGGWGGEGEGGEGEERWEVARPLAMTGKDWH